MVVGKVVVEQLVEARQAGIAKVRIRLRGRNLGVVSIEHTFVLVLLPAHSLSTAIAKVGPTPLAGHVVAPLALLDINMARRARRRVIPHPRLHELLELIIADERKERLCVARPQALRDHRAALVVRLEVLVHDSLAVANGAWGVRTVPCRAAEHAERVPAAKTGAEVVPAQVGA